MSSWSARSATVALVSVLAIAFFGRYVAPYSPVDLVGAPYEASSESFRLGTDYIGEDVLSRVLFGGRRLVIVATTATLVAYLLGGAIGVLSGLTRSIIDPVLMRTVDLLLAFPSLFLVLLLASRFGTSTTIVIVGITIVHVPLIARVVRTASLEVSVKGYVEAAVARGDSTFSIMRRQILPNIAHVISADAGPRFTVSILLVAGLNFLGIGAAPPAPDWAVMVNENRSGFDLNRWAVLAPAVLIGVLTVSANVLADVYMKSQREREIEGVA